MVVAPGVSAVTTPAAVTVATDVADDVQVDADVTSCVVPSDSVAVALNCPVAPTCSVGPMTATDITDELGPVEHAVSASARPPASERVISRWVMRVSPLVTQKTSHSSYVMPSCPGNSPSVLRPPDAELPHPGLERGALQPQPSGGAVRPAHNAA